MGAAVIGSGAEPYTVTIDWAGVEHGEPLLVACDCPRFDAGFPCKHLWGTMRALDAQNDGRRPSGSGRLEVVPGWEFLSDAPDDREEDAVPEGRAPEPAADSETRPVAPEDLDGLEGLRLSREAPGPHAPRGGPGRDWRHRLSELDRNLRTAWKPGPVGPSTMLIEPPKRVELWPQVDLQATRSSGLLTIALYQRQERRSGGMGILKPLSLDPFRGELLSEPSDRALAELLLALDLGIDPWALSYYGSRARAIQPAVRTLRIPAGLYEVVLPNLAAPGRLGWWEGSGDRPDPDRRLAWDPGPPFRPVLEMEPAGEGGAWISGTLRRGDEVVPLEEPLLHLSNGLVILRDRVARLDAGGVFPWIASLRFEGRIRVPDEEVPEAVRTLGRLPTLPLLEVDDALPVEAETPPATSVLRIEGGEPGGGRTGALAAQVCFRYGEHRVEAGDPRSVVVMDAPALGGRKKTVPRILRRDRPAEDAALGRLEELGVVAGPERGHVGLPREPFARIVEELLQDGWEVEARGVKLRSGSGVRMSVVTGVDWFELSGEVRFDGEAVALPRLLEAARRGQDYVELGDGSHGLLPREWLERFGPLADLAGGEPARRGGDGGSLRFLPSQALLLDALLASSPAALQAEIQVDRGFSRLRDRLVQGHEIGAVDEPEGFRGTLRPYQKTGLAWLDFLTEVGLGGCLADDMGLGKTIQVLALLLERKHRGAGGATGKASLVVAPRSLVYNWLDETSRFAPGLATLDYTGTRRKALRSRFGEHDLVVTTYGTLRRDAAALSEIPLDVAILDEAQAIKNAASQTAKAARLLRAEHRLALTGTPVENHLTELASLFEFLNPGMLGRSSRFQRLFDTRRVSAQEDEPALADLARALSPFILRRTKAQVLPDLPPKTEQTLKVTLPRQQRLLYDELRDHYRAHLTRRIDEVGLGRTKIQVLEALLRLRQAACHPALLDDERAGETSAKLEALREQLQEVLQEGHKALVFSQFTKLLALVRRDLDRQGLVYEYLDGSTRDRSDRVQRFQHDPECRLFLISLKAGGTGLNLTAADYVFLLDPWWNPAVEAQAVDRTHRIGQDRPVIAYRLIARDTVEEKILELQDTKRELAEAILSASGGALKKLTAEDLELLLG